LKVAGLLPSMREAQEDDPLAHLSLRECDVFFNLMNGLRAKGDCQSPGYQQRR